MSHTDSRLDAVEINRHGATGANALVDQGLDLAWGPRQKPQTDNPNIKLAMGEDFSRDDWAGIYKHMYGYDLLAQPLQIQDQKIRQLYRYMNGYHPGE